MRAIVHTPFHLSRDDGSSANYGVGEHDMPDADANHWWTALHADVKKGGKKSVKSPALENESLGEGEPQP